MTKRSTASRTRTRSDAKGAETKKAPRSGLKPKGTAPGTPKRAPGRRGTRTVPARAATITEDQIAERAYHIWMAEGCPEGRDFQHWLAAKQELTFGNQNTLQN